MTQKVSAVKHFLTGLTRLIQTHSGGLQPLIGTTHHGQEGTYHVQAKPAFLHKMVESILQTVSPATSKVSASVHLPGECLTQLRHGNEISTLLYFPFFELDRFSYNSNARAFVGLGRTYPPDVCCYLSNLILVDSI